VNQLTRQIERVQNAGGEEDDGNTFNMTKVTDDGASRKSAKQDDKPVSQGTKSINLPDVTVKDPFLDPEITTGHKSAASSRNNFNKVRSTTHKRAVSNAAGTGSRYR
jgi:hypothetical protein